MTHGRELMAVAPGHKDNFIALISPEHELLFLGALVFTSYTL